MSMHNFGLHTDIIIRKLKYSFNKLKVSFKHAAAYCSNNALIWQLFRVSVLGCSQV